MWAWNELNTLLRRSFLLRWTLVNIAGWSIGLYFGSITLAIVGGIVGVILAGAVAGCGAGGMQWLVLRHEVGISARRWLVYNMIGSAAASIPVLLASVTLFAGPNLGMAIMGGVYGLCFGWAQIAALEGQNEAVIIWVLLNALSGCLCAGFSLAWSPNILPIFCTPGPLLFGLLTGYGLMHLQAEDEIMSKEDDV